MRNYSLLRKVASFTAGTKRMTPKSPKSSQYRYFSSTTAADDLLLQNSFDDYTKIKILSSSLFNTKAIEEAEQLISKDVVPGFADALWVHVDLQNPLLKKYGFDAQDFYAGAKEALYQVWTTASSQEFFEYANELRQSSEKAQYIQDNCHPNVYNSFIDVSRKLKDADLQSIRIIDFGFHSVILSGIDTTVVKETDLAPAIQPISLLKQFFTISPKGTKSKAMNFTFDSVMSSVSLLDGGGGTDSSNLSDTSDHRKLNAAAIYEWNATHFPVGSVVATAYVEYESYEVADFVIKDKSKLSNQLVSKGVCTFHGCISGQKELEWKITSLSIQ